MSKEILLKHIDLYQKKTGYTESTVSNKLMGNGSWLGDLRSGKIKTITMATYEKVMGIVS